MRDVCCSMCNAHLGWMNDAGPCGAFYCDYCKERDEEEESEPARKALGSRARGRGFIG